MDTGQNVSETAPINVQDRGRLELLNRLVRKNRELALQRVQGAGVFPVFGTEGALEGGSVFLDEVECSSPGVPVSDFVTGALVHLNHHGWVSPAFIFSVEDAVPHGAPDPFFVACRGAGGANPPVDVVGIGDDLVPAKVETNGAVLVFLKALQVKVHDFQGSASCFQGDQFAFGDRPALCGEADLGPVEASRIGTCDDQGGMESTLYGCFLTEAFLEVGHLEKGGVIGKPLGFGYSHGAFLAPVRGDGAREPDHDSRSRVSGWVAEQKARQDGNRS